MNIGCNELERVLARREPAEMAALEEHAAACAACRLHLDLDHEITAAAHAMRKQWESPGLWPRIEQALMEERLRRREKSWSGWAWRDLFGRGLAWQTAAALIVLGVVSATGTWLLLHRATPAERWQSVRQGQAEQRLLTEQALGDVERAEATYRDSIEKLSALAEPRLGKADPALRVNYREKLLVLDAAIAECRSQVERNRFHAQLRRELLNIYQAKQRTLEEIVKEN